MILVQGALVGCARESEPDLGRARQAVEAVEAPEEGGSSEPGEGHDPETEVVYQLVRILDREGNELSRSEEGAIDRHIWRKAARPDPLVDGEYIYQNVAQLGELEDGTIRSTLTYTRRINDVIYVPIDDPPPKRNAQEVFEPREDGRIHLAVKIAGYAEWDVPLALPRGVFSAEEEEAGAVEREAGFAARRETFEERVQPVAALIEELGGERSEASSWRSGWVGALIDPGRLEALLESSLVARVSGLDGETKLLAWNLGDAGQPTRYNTDQFLTSYFDGNDTTIGVLEPGLLNDEACFLREDANCTGATRLLSRFDCHDPVPGGGACDAVVNLDDDGTFNTSQHAHANLVTASAMADYLDGQATGFKVGDSAWTSGNHSYTWASRASSLAPEVGLRFGGGWTSTSDAVEAIEKLAATDVVAINISWTQGAIDKCDTGTDAGVDEAVENAFDDGKLMVIAAGNNPIPDADDPKGVCDVQGHAALLKAFAVNGLSTNPLDLSGNCAVDYRANCSVEIGASAMGGADATTPDNVVHPRALSLISLAAAQGAQYVTGDNCIAADSEKGWVWSAVPSGPHCQGGGNSGASLAAPVVTGASALVHEWAVSWFGAASASGVGTLHTLMLGMGDSRDSNGWFSSSQRTTGADSLYGMGRLKAHMSASALLTTATLTAGSGYTGAILGPLPAGTDFLKCVALQHEDMSSKTKISDVTLSVKLRNPVFGSTCSSGGSVFSTTTDAGYDVKSMVAIRSSNVAGKCPYITLTANAVTSLAVKVGLFCYASTEDDDEPN